MCVAWFDFRKVQLSCRNCNYKQCYELIENHVAHFLRVLEREVEETWRNGTAFTPGLVVAVVSKTFKSRPLNVTKRLSFQPTEPRFAEQPRNFQVASFRRWPSSSMRFVPKENRSR